MKHVSSGFSPRRAGAGTADGPAEVHASYGGGLHLVRPGGCIGWAGQDRAGLAGRLGRVTRC